MPTASPAAARPDPAHATTLSRLAHAWLFQFGAMGGDCEVHIAGNVSEDHARNAAQAAILEVRRIEAKYSRYRADSALSRINASAGRGPSAVDAETASLLAYAHACFEASDGRFDITAGVLRRAWDFRAGLVPTRERLAGLLPLVGWERVRRTADAIELPDEGMELDLGGIGKEYAADRAAAACRDAGIRHGLVNLGGDVRVIGPHPDGSPWTVGIRDPRDADGTIATVALTAGALATSGDYERYFERDGERYCHILDPSDGMPVRHWRSVSVIAPVCVSAGSYATIAMLLGARAAARLQAEGLPHLLVGPDGAISGSLQAMTPDTGMHVPAPARPRA